MRAAAEAAGKAAKAFGVARPICLGVTVLTSLDRKGLEEVGVVANVEAHVLRLAERAREAGLDGCVASPQEIRLLRRALGDRKSTRLNSSHGYISYAVFCLKKKKKKHITPCV